MFIIDSVMSSSSSVQFPFKGTPCCTLRGHYGGCSLQWPVSEARVKECQSIGPHGPWCHRQGARKYKRAPAEYVILYAVFRSRLFEMRVKDQGRWAVWNVCLRSRGFWYLRTRTIYLSCVLVRSLRVQCSRALNALIVSVIQWEALFAFFPLLERWVTSVCVLRFESRCCRGNCCTSKTLHAGFTGFKDALFGLSDPADSARVEQQFRMCASVFGF